MADTKPADAPKTVEVIVARGHTVRTAQGSHGPGERAMVAETDVAQLRQRGFIADPSAPSAPAAAPEGATITKSDGPSVTKTVDTAGDAGAKAAPATK